MRAEEAKGRSTLVLSTQAPAQSATARCDCCKLATTFETLSERYGLL